MRSFLRPLTFVPGRFDALKYIFTILDMNDTRYRLLCFSFDSNIEYDVEDGLMSFRLIKAVMLQTVVIYCVISFRFF